MADTNHDQFAHDNEFSSYGDIDRVTGSNTTPESKIQNDLAYGVLRQSADTERAFPQAGAGGSINERTASHEYGYS